MFLEYIYGLLAKLSIPVEEKNQITDIVNAQIKKWLEMLVDHVDMWADDVLTYFTLLCQDLRPVQLSTKFKHTIT